VSEDDAAKEGQRLQDLQRRLGVTLAELGEVFGCSANTVYKLQFGLTRITGLRMVVLEALEAALFRFSVEQVWGPRVPVPARPNAAALPKTRPITPAQRLARIFQAAHPEAGGLR
jgi:transcriptional regulator with XRE-family HTH domain